jgi:hypothetical protein
MQTRVTLRCAPTAAGHLVQSAQLGDFVATLIECSLSRRTNAQLGLGVGPNGVRLCLLVSMVGSAVSQETVLEQSRMLQGGYEGTRCHSEFLIRR